MTEEKLKHGYALLDAIKDLEQTIKTYENHDGHIVTRANYRGDKCKFKRFCSEGAET